MKIKDVKEILIELKKSQGSGNGEELNAKYDEMYKILIEQGNRLDSNCRELILLTLLNFRPDIDLIRKTVDITNTRLNGQELTLLILHGGEYERFAKEYARENQIDLLELSMVTLPEGMTYGIEIESQKITRDKYWDIILGWKGKYEPVIENGQEHIPEENKLFFHANSKEDVRSIYYACYMLDKYGAIVDSESTGGHVHIGANYLDDSEGLSYLIIRKLWTKMENLVLMTCNQKGELMRESQDFYAREVCDDGVFTKSVNLDSNEDVKEWIAKNWPEEIRDDGDEKPERRFTLNGSNLKPKKPKYSHWKYKDTLEFRASNGTKDPVTWIENINLYGSIVEISRRIADAEHRLSDEEYVNHPQNADDVKKMKEDIHIYEQIMSEGNMDKLLELYLQLAFDDEKQRDVYRERYNASKAMMENEKNNEEERG